MSKLSESLIILNFIGLKLESIFNILINYGVTDFQTGVNRGIYRKLYNLGIDEKELDSEKYKNFIEKESSELFGLIHENLSKGIIDLYSFKQEYDSFFNIKCIDDVATQNKIQNFKEKNKTLINQIDWDEIKDLRNTILAHNLRDKKNNNQIASYNMTRFVNLSLDYKKCLLYFTQMTKLYDILKTEFAFEMKIAFREYIKHYIK